MLPTEPFLWRGLVNWFDRRSRLEIGVIALVLIAAIGIVNHWTSPEYATSIFYLLPILLGAWFAGGEAGVALCMVSAGVEFVADLPWHFEYEAARYWNVAVRLTFYLLFTGLVTRLRRALQQARELAGTDPLTGVANRRAFYERAAVEISRGGRSPRPFTVACIDLDNFKEVNDRWGHLAGDEALCTVCQTLRENIRSADVVARLGGDEFALLLPDTDAAGARAGLAKLRELLLHAMARRHWPVTFSIGAVTFQEPPPSIDGLIQRADDLMYAVKQEGKDCVKFAVVDCVKV